MKFLKRSVVTAALVLGTTSSAYAVTCAGVEARVNARTSTVAAAVTSLIATRQAALITQEIAERQRMLSAVRVLTQQMAVSGQQEVVADRAANLALASTIVEQSVNTQTREVVQNYSNTGHNACGIVEQGYTVASMVESYDTTRRDMAERVRVARSPATEAEFRQMMGDWSQLVQTADDATIAAVLNGDEAQAEAFIAIVAGPPRPPLQQGTGSVFSQQERVIAMQEEARSSAATLVLADIAASRRVELALDAMTAEWIGDDGGAAWAASMASSPTRAVLLDTARIRSQLIASMALELKRSVMEEFALATFSLTYSDRMRERLAEGTR